tara:strand:- start:3430 stop:3693 length:264 start_codon:yes stop_codon:yes gene_type:complete
MELYKPFKNNTNSKYKFFVYVKADNKRGYKKIGFGDKNYKDFTQHKDPERRKRYLARAKGIKDKEGNLTYKNKNSANYFSVKYLWNG